VTDPLYVESHASHIRYQLHLSFIIIYTKLPNLGTLICTDLFQ